MARHVHSRVRKLNVPAAPDSVPRYAVLPLRMFLGATFAYAGLQKLADPGYFTPGSPTYIGSQMQAFAASSPIGFLFHWLALPLAPEVGAAVIAAELCIGSLALLGAFTRWAAALGALLSLTLFLSATWDVQPYFLGSDSIYTVAWITLALVGDGGVLSVQAELTANQRAGDGLQARRRETDHGRRLALLRIGGASVGLVWLLAVLPRGRGHFVAEGAPLSTPPATDQTSNQEATVLPQASGVTTTATVAPATATAIDTAVPSPFAEASLPAVASTTRPVATATAPPTPMPIPSPSGTVIGQLAQLQHAGGGLSYQDPGSGDPAVVIDLGGNKLVAYDAICTHAGCTVQYDSQQRLLFCPCHGAVFDPTHQGAPVQGPARRALTPLTISLAADGKIYATS
ncbi:MAG TPA: TQO small subunit DoxD [Chloroflexota bacterium]|nr:TQO small subunit DoxD [Chloroflexota bacterium]